MTEALVTTGVMQAIPAIMKDLCPTLEKFVGQVSDTVKTIGCKDQLALVEALKTTVPAFAQYSERFVSLLSEYVMIEERTTSKNYELIVQNVLNSDLTVQQKVDAVIKIENNHADNRIRNVEANKGFVTTILNHLAIFSGIGGATIIGWKALAEKGKTDRSPWSKIGKRPKR